MATRALLVYPEFPPTYWGMRYTLPFLGRKATLPPLGLLTVAAMLPPDWDLRVLDMNVEPLGPRDLAGVDLVFLSAMLAQRESFDGVVDLCQGAGIPVVAGGPYPTSCHAAITGVASFVLGEAEVNLPPFLRDLEEGIPRRLYGDPGHPPLDATPPPRYDLIDPLRYTGGALQYSRGCPHHCEFCDIVELFGHQPRTKAPAQFLRELDRLEALGWQGSLFIVDDNFIGNRPDVRRLLPALASWQTAHGFPFTFFTEASLDLAADPALMESMVRAGFNMVFVGLETPDRATLEAAQKTPNTGTDLLAAVHAIQAKGLEVAGGFIVGFDGDKADIFDRQAEFIEKAGIPTAMVGLLTALPGTRLHRRLKAEGRLVDPLGSGNNTHDAKLNFRPVMDPDLLQEGYLQVLKDIYTPHRYFARCLQLLDRMPRTQASCRRVRAMEVRACLHSLLRQTFSRYGFDYLAYLFRALGRRPGMVSEIIAMAVKGHHYITITDRLLALEAFKSGLARLQQTLVGGLGALAGDDLAGRTRLLAQWRAIQRHAGRVCLRFHPDFRARAIAAFTGFMDAVEALLAPAFPWDPRLPATHPVRVRRGTPRPGPGLSPADPRCPPRP